MIYFIKAITDLIGKFGWWSAIAIPVILVFIALGVEVTGGFNTNTGSKFLEDIFNMIFKQVDGE